MNYGRVPGVDKPVARIVQGTVMIRSERKGRKNGASRCSMRSSPRRHHVRYGPPYAGGDCERTLAGGKGDRGLLERSCNRQGRSPQRGPQAGDPLRYHGRTSTTPGPRSVRPHRPLPPPRDDPSGPVGPIVEVLNEHKEEGRIHSFAARTGARAPPRGERLRRENGLTPWSRAPNLSLAVQIKSPGPTA